MSLSCAGVEFSYEEGGQAIPALTDATFDLRAGGSLALLGASGSGKSTLLQTVRGLNEPDRGVVELDGLGPAAPDYAGRRRETGLVFQMAEMQLFADSAAEDVAFGPRQLGWDQADVDAAVTAALERVGLPRDRFGARHPYALSGGEQRRLALAGVLAMRPRLLLLDEPFVSLDPGTRHELLAILQGLKASGVTILLATHDVDVAWALCDECLLLDRGRVVTAGAWDLSEEGARLLAANRLREPFLAQLWRRLGREPAAAPRTVEDAARLLA